jgi:hypothetical protein
MASKEGKLDDSLHPLAHYQGLCDEVQKLGCAMQNIFRVLFISAAADEKTAYRFGV